MIGLIYFLVIVAANTVGAISGMGGGVLIKPIFDFIGAHSLAAISFYSSMAVFTMSIVSTIRQLKNKVTIHWGKALLISVGSMGGGVLGNSAFEWILRFSSERTTQIVQIVLTIITLLFALIYSKKEAFSFSCQISVVYVFVGFILGFLASLLGIGGGPINVAMLMLFFGLTIKEATVYSIITIFFSQSSKLFAIFLSSSYQRYDLSLFLFIIPAAILGGWFGAKVSGVLPADKVNTVYQGVIILVLLINCFNGIKLFF
ncbi:sulfite exporter TauE/SafE family protein [Enterococcus malodoratus]|uniref:Probable membrane transporter protein n=1 Tax=Enterococcus malodoratus ATCC 43197 TaxID=1158601 RepID=R2REK5_9ENTE|nr:sulfite exporter TauE/SafE family protein [Enterococcus malodoratus]EOH74404.1 hypothetical protein UAI_03473 [Enterococcus malodoratus ATCC 43197]EOT67134.1 hypothetical protein I585_02655 [Enterococcus malodoratus ATCC 43197]OJG58336.1 hypothetical protein RV07_GL002903 [Enterococcus malodoratus]SPW90987.1 sulfite exporter TauE/SafE [Enterococcus malodoratus]STD69614.1 sulfite exporter TauE/SafE [Enterococcus malodoratus]